MHRTKRQRRKNENKSNILQRLEIQICLYNKGNGQFIQTVNTTKYKQEK